MVFSILERLNNVCIIESIHSVSAVHPVRLDGISESTCKNIVECLTAILTFSNFRKICETLRNGTDEPHRGKQRL